MKKIISLILVAVTLICVLPMNALADETRNLVTALADNDTSALVSRFSLSEEDDGRVEVDKSVNYNTDLYNVFDNYNTDEFSVTLSALGQAYTSSITEETESSESMHTDVLFILDVSSSMYDNKMSGSTQNRVYGTVEALNVAINKLKEADPEVRFGIICYGTNYYAGTTRSETATTWTDSTSVTVTSNWTQYTVDGKTFWAKFSNNRVMLNTKKSDTGATTISSGVYYKINGVIVKSNGTKTITCSTGKTTKSTTINYESGIYLPIGKYSLAGGTTTSTETETITVTDTWTQHSIGGTTFYTKTSSSGYVYVGASTSRTNATRINSGSTVAYGGLTITNNSNVLTISYTTEITSTVNNGEWVTYTANVATSTDRISTSANIRDENGNAVAVTSRDVATNKDGTYTQAGLQAAVTMFNNVVDKENRVPATVLVTDGVPTIADEDIYTVDAFPGNSSSRDEMLHSIRNIINYGYASYIGDSTKNGYASGTPIEAGLTIKTALEVKKRIDTMYEDADALYFTIGPGVDYNFGKLFLDPSVENMEGAKNDTTANSTMYGSATPKTLYEWLSTNMTDSSYNELTTLADYSIADNFTIEKYEQAMEVLVGHIVNKVTRPVVIKKTTETIVPSMSSTNYLYFEDTLDNMVIKGEPCLVSNDITYSPISRTTTSEYTEYKYELTNTSVFVYADKVVWIFGSELLPLIMLNKTGGYSVSTPIRCIFKVGVDVIDDIDEVFFTNERCNALFTPVSNNPYYKNYTKTTLSKESNTTNTLDFVCDYNAENDNIVALLGNNGKINFDIWFNNQTLVLDYGLPVEYNLKGNNEIDAEYEYTAYEEEGKYGRFSVTADGGTRYEINTMQFVSTDTFDVGIKVNSICGVNANLDYAESITYIPAKIIYFEDDFVSFDDKWESVGNTIEDCQADELLGDIENNNVYGYDTANDVCTTYSMGSAMKTTILKGNTVFPKATFTFTGTGFDIISVTDNESALMTVTIKNHDTGKTYKKTVVDNYYGVIRDEETGEITYQPGDGENALYQIPVLKYFDMPYATYDVTIEARYITSMRKQDVEWKNEATIYVDAIRIYSPAPECEDYYAQDNEGYAEFVNIHKQCVSQTAETINGIMLIDGDTSTSSFNDLLTLAPNNEVYLNPNQSIAFSLDGDSSKVATVQVGFKSITGEAVTIRVANKDNMTTLSTASCTDQYHKIGTDIDEEYVITNRGSAVVSLTNIKITYSSNPNVPVAFVMPRMTLCMAMAYAPDVVEEPETEPIVDETTTQEETTSEIVTEPTIKENVETTTETYEDTTIEEPIVHTTNSFVKFIKMIVELIKKMFK